MNFGIDIDGCLANFNIGYAKLLRQVNGNNLLPDNWWTDPNWPPVWFWERHYGYSREVETKVWNEHIRPSKNFWSRLPVYPHTGETIKQLDRLAKNGHTVYYITNRHGQTARYQTEKWLYEHGMDYPTVIMIADKIPIVKLLGIDFFVDDKIETVTELAQAVVESPEGFKCKDNIYLKDAAYNRAGRRADIKVVSSIRQALTQIGVWEDGQQKQSV